MLDRALSGLELIFSCQVQYAQSPHGQPPQAAIHRRRHGRGRRDEDQIKGFQVDRDNYLAIEESDLDEIRIESTHTLEIEKFVPRAEIDPRYMDVPYYIAPTEKVGEEAFAVIRNSMREEGVVGLGRVVMSRRERIIMLEPWEKGLLGTMLRYGYEVRGEEPYFEDVPELNLDKDLKEMAKLIIKRKFGHFNPSGFNDRYEDAVVEMVRDKQAGAKPRPAKTAPASGNVINLMDALKRSLSGAERTPPEHGRCCAQEAGERQGEPARSAAVQASDRRRQVEGGRGAEGNRREAFAEEGVVSASATDHAVVLWMQHEGDIYSPEMSLGRSSEAAIERDLWEGAYPGVCQGIYSYGTHANGGSYCREITQDVAARLGRLSLATRRRPAELGARLSRSLRHRIFRRNGGAWRARIGGSSILRDAAASVGRARTQNDSSKRRAKPLSALELRAQPQFKLPIAGGREGEGSRSDDAAERGSPAAVRSDQHARVDELSLKDERPHAEQEAAWQRFDEKLREMGIAAAGDGGHRSKPVEGRADPHRKSASSRS